MWNLIYGASKKDEDIRVLEDEKGNVFLETSAPILPGATLVEENPQPTFAERIKEAVADDSVVEQTITEPLADIRVQSILFIFAGNSAVQFIWLILSGLLYYLNAYEPSLIIICITAPLFCVSYAIMLWLRSVSMIPFIVWVLNAGVMMGSISVLVNNVAPMQLTLLFLVQSFTMLAYAKLSPRMIETLHAMAFMFVVTLVTWAVFIFAFVEQHDWVGGIVILFISFAAIGYSAWQIRLTEGRYNVSWKDIKLSIVQFYGDPLIQAYCEIKRRMDK